MRLRLLLALFAVAIAVLAIVLVTHGGDSDHASTRAVAQRATPAWKPARSEVHTRARVKLPAGSLRVKQPKLTAGTSDTSLRLGLKIDRPAPGARVELQLPKRFVERS